MIRMLETILFESCKNTNFTDFIISFILQDNKQRNSYVLKNCKLIILFTLDFYRLIVVFRWLKPIGISNAI